MSALAAIIMLLVGFGKYPSGPDTTHAYVSVASGIQTPLENNFASGWFSLARKLE